MARDGSGNYSRVVTPPTNGDVADADDFNAEINDIASEITASLEKSGKATWTGNQNANGFGVRSLANTKVHTTAGGTTTYTVTTGASFTSYANLPLIFVKANATNTGSMTINVDSIGALTVKKNGATNLASGDFVQDYIYALAYDGTNLQLIGGTLAAGFQPLDATLTALAALSTSASQYIRATGTDAFTMDSYATVLSNIGAAALAGGNAFAGHQGLVDAGFFNYNRNTGGTTDRRTFGWLVSGGGAFLLRFLNDNLTTKATALTIATSGDALDLASWGCPVQGRVPLSSETTGTLSSASANKKVVCTGGITLNDGVFTTDDFTLFDPGTSNRTFTRDTGCTMYVNGTDSASATLAANQMGVAHWRSSTVVVLSGAFT